MNNLLKGKQSYAYAKKRQTGHEKKQKRKEEDILIQGQEEHKLLQLL